MITSIKDFSINENIIIYNYINDIINENDIINYFEGLNENLSFNFIKDKIINILYTFLINSYKIGFKILTKLDFIITQILKLINNFKNKYPLLYKIIILSIITFIILIISCVSTYAANTKNVLPIENINIAIGWLDYIKHTNNYDNIEVSKAIAHLVDLKDGKIDILNLNKKSLDIAQSAINTANEIIKNSKLDYKNGDTDGNKAISLFIELLEKGKSYIDVIYTKTSNTENFELIIK